MDSMTLLASVLTAGAVMLVFFGLRSVAAADQGNIIRRLRQSSPGSDSPQAGTADVLVTQRPLNILSSLDMPLHKFGWAKKAQADLERAEIHLHLGEFIAIRLALTTISFVVVLLIAGSGLLGIAIAIGAGAIAWFGCSFYVRRRVGKRQAALERQLDRALMSIATSMRSGFSFLQGVRLTTQQLEWPLKDELEIVLDDVGLGATIEQALTDMAGRANSYEMDIAVTAVVVQRTVGGDLAEILDNTARTIRDRRELRGHIMSLTAQQRLSAIFVCIIPPGMAALLSLTSYQFMRPLWETGTGHILVIASAIFDIVGFLVIKRLTRIDF
jgi:tight adherence protein B